MGLIIQHYLYFFSSYPNLLSGYYLCLLYYAYNSTNEKVENHYDEQVESYYDEQAKTKVFPKINIKKNIKNNIQRDSNSDFSPWDSDTSTSQIFG